MSLTTFVVCPECHDKRCPKADNHMFICQKRITGEKTATIPSPLTLKPNDGTPAARLNNLITALSARLPEADIRFTGDLPEDRLLAALDKVLYDRRGRLENTLVSVVLNACVKADQFNPNRTVQDVLAAVMAEVGETAEEVNIHAGRSYKKPGPDGVYGEAVDAICALIDLIYQIKSNVTEVEITSVARRKTDKWLEKLAEHQAQNPKPPQSSFDHPE